MQGTVEPCSRSHLQLTCWEQESYEIGSEDNPGQPNIWLPDSTIPRFRLFMTDFYWTLFNTAGSMILRALALGIGLEEDHLLKLHSGHFNQLRLLHYPPLPAEAVASGHVARMPAHSDWSTITLLFQDDCGGLEVEDPAVPESFISVLPLKGALVMNVGDLLMRWSNGQLSHSWSAPGPLLGTTLMESRLAEVNISPGRSATHARSLLRPRTRDESKVLDSLLSDHRSRFGGRMHAILRG